MVLVPVHLRRYVSNCNQFECGRLIRRLKPVDFYSRALLQIDVKIIGLGGFCNLPFPVQLQLPSCDLHSSQSTHPTVVLTRWYHYYGGE